jgi:hypothetical protein
MSETTDTTTTETEIDTQVIADETPAAPTSKRGKRKAKATSVELQDVSQEKDEATTEVETTEAEATEETVDSLAAIRSRLLAALPKTLEEKILAIAPGTPSRTLLRALHVNKTGGTAAITTAGTLVFLPSHAPEKGGKQTLSRSGRIRAFVADL